VEITREGYLGQHKLSKEDKSASTTDGRREIEKRKFACDLNYSHHPCKGGERPGSENRYGPQENIECRWREKAQEAGSFLVQKKGKKFFKRQYVFPTHVNRTRVSAQNTV